MRIGIIVKLQGSVVQASRKLKDYLTERPKPKGIDVLCGLKHFAIITYAVPTERFQGIFPDRFKLDTVEIDGQEMGLISVVPFIDVDFTSAVFPFPKFTMGQTNYRIYIIDTETGERCVWFLGTTLDSWTLAVPRYLWNLPWYAGKVNFDCTLNKANGLYEKYSMKTLSDWAEASVDLVQSEHGRLEFPGFPDVESALVYLTHPLAGFYYRRDGKLGMYRVWHKELEVKSAQLISANFMLLSDLGIVKTVEQNSPYSVLIEPINEFTIYLPPATIG
ncbi:DUF2071 domain-containing protein [Paraglaciecola chathamensis]|uniref:DUF2071 domain-containing protein n=1 Tax=Paraglaciecola chathamensis TaxID=368405 RepID=UPI0023553BBF|nr:DUF2071 domain-containing protein [Paraglaciecola agarilytica]|tara:strand:+ start:68401 stop:69228 length:828 start_codon:yes stop_codon:yes gene_type:complete